MLVQGVGFPNTWAGSPSMGKHQYDQLSSPLAARVCTCNREGQYLGPTWESQNIKEGSWWVVETQAASVHAQLLSYVQFFWAHGLKPTRLFCPWNFPGKKYWSGLLFPFSRGSFWPRDQTCISCIRCTGRWFFYHCAPWESHRLQVSSLMHPRWHSIGSKSSADLDCILSLHLT